MTIIEIIILFFVVAFIIIVGLAILNQFFEPYKSCEGKDDDFIVQIGNTNISCGELKTMNVTGGKE